MKVYDFTLKSNGLKIVYIEKKDSEVVAMSLIGKCGSVFENIAGTAHFFEHLSLDGSQKYPNKKDFLSLVMDSGGSVHAVTSKDFTEFTTKLIGSEIERGLELLSQAVFYPIFDKKSIDKEKKIIIEEYKRALTNDQRQLFETLVGLSYKDESMNRMVLGNNKSVELINKDVLKQFWYKYYHPNNFVLSVCGNIGEKKLFKMIEKYFGDIPKGGYVKNKTFEYNKESNLEIIKRENAIQARLMLAYASPERNSDEYYASLLLSSILGKGMFSRLFQIVREEKQLVYDISSWNWTGLNRGLFYSQCGVDEKNINEVIRIITNEQDNLATKKITDKEIDIHKKRIKSASLFEIEDSVQLASHYSQLRITLNELVTLDDEIKKIDKITPDEIISIAKKIFNQKPHIAILAKKINKDQIITLQK